MVPSCGGGGLANLRGVHDQRGTAVFMITIPSDLRPGDCSDCIKSPWKLRGAKVRQGELEELS